VLKQASFFIFIFDELQSHYQRSIIYVHIILIQFSDFQNYFSNNNLFTYIALFNIQSSKAHYDTLQHYNYFQIKENLNEWLYHWVTLKWIIKDRPFFQDSPSLVHMHSNPPLGLASTVCFHEGVWLNYFLTFITDKTFNKQSVRCWKLSPLS